MGIVFMFFYIPTGRNKNKNVILLNNIRSFPLSYRLFVKAVR